MASLPAVRDAFAAIGAQADSLKRADGLCRAVQQALTQPASATVSDAALRRAVIDATDGLLSVYDRRNAEATVQGALYLLADLPVRHDNVHHRIDSDLSSLLDAAAEARRHLDVSCTVADALSLLSVCLLPARTSPRVVAEAWQVIGSLVGCFRAMSATLQRAEEALALRQECETIDVALGRLAETCAELHSTEEALGDLRLRAEMSERKAQLDAMKSAAAAQLPNSDRTTIREAVRVKRRAANELRSSLALLVAKVPAARAHLPPFLAESIQPYLTLDMDEVVTGATPVPGAGRHRMLFGTHVSGSPVIVKLFEAAALPSMAREAGVLRRFGGLCTPRLIDAFVTPDGRPALVLQRVASDLTAWAATACADANVMRGTFLGVLRALAQLHASGIVHLDVKAANVVVDAEGAPLLIDFDVSVDDAERCRTVTNTRFAAGTPGMMAPELLRTPPSISAKADVYSFGAMVRGLIEGRPFAAEPLWTSLVADATMDDPRNRPSAAALMASDLFWGLPPDVRTQSLRQLPPLYWSSSESRSAVSMSASGGATAEVVRLESGSVEFTALAALLHNTCVAATLGTGRDQQEKTEYNTLELAEAYRVENSAVWKRYAARREELRGGDGAGEVRGVPDIATVRLAGKATPLLDMMQLDDAAGEAVLWHGTKPDIVPVIRDGGFDERFCALEGLFGAGVYFAEQSSKSDQYCTKDAAGLYSLFLSRVSLGRVHHTSGPRTNERRAPDGADSLLGRAGPMRYREFVVYDRTQCYPEYLLLYRRVRR